MKPKKKKVLIISMTAGFGHIRAGEALLDYAKEYLPAVDAEHVDVVDLDPFFKKNVTRFYDTLSKKYPFLWGLAYKVSDIRITSVILKKLGVIPWILNRKLKQYLEVKKPDAIIFTNLFPLGLVDSYLLKKFPGTKIGLVVTDYHGHSHYAFSSPHYYFVGHEKVQAELERVRVPKEKIIISGIPINPRFYLKQSVTALKAKYGVKSSLPVVLCIASFKMAESDLVAMVSNVLDQKPNVQVIFIANGNIAYYNAIKKNFAAHARLILVNWTNKMEEYIKISNVVISKAGGLTVSECLSLKKQMIMINPIPGQEEYNAEFVQKYGYGVRIHSPGELKEVLPRIIASSKGKGQEALLPENPGKTIFERILS